MRKNGFTLVELVLAMGAMSLISLAVMSVYKNMGTLTKNSDNGIAVNNFFNEVRMKTVPQLCMASLGMGDITLPASLEDTVLVVAAPELQKFDKQPSNLKLTHIKLLQSSVSDEIYSAILSVDVALQTKKDERKTVQASLIYIKTDKTRKGIECSNKPI